MAVGLEAPRREDKSCYVELYFSLLWRKSTGESLEPQGETTKNKSGDMNNSSKVSLEKAFDQQVENSG